MIAVQLANGTAMRPNCQSLRAQSVKINAGCDCRNREPVGEIPDRNLALLFDEIEDLASPLFG
jgi:hypothetical protein